MRESRFLDAQHNLHWNPHVPGFRLFDCEFSRFEGSLNVYRSAVHQVPALIDELSRRWKIPKNFMFIGSPGDHFLYGLAELGGVRLII